MSGFFDRTFYAYLKGDHFNVPGKVRCKGRGGDTVISTAVHQFSTMPPLFALLDSCQLGVGRMSIGGNNQFPEEESYEQADVSVHTGRVYAV